MRAERPRSQRPAERPQPVFRRRTGSGKLKIAAGGRRCRLWHAVAGPSILHLRPPLATVSRRKLFSDRRSVRPLRFVLGVEGRGPIRPAQTQERITQPMPETETRPSRRAVIAGGVAGGILTTLPARSQTGSRAMETTIRVDDAVTTLVNVFTVEPGKQPEVLALLQDGTDTMFSKMPGWISTNLLKSRDGKQVVVYSQWRDAKDIAAFRQEPRMQPYFARFDGLAKQVSFTCDVSYGLHV
jgi:quinol monooxygenase YgiN